MMDAPPEEIMRKVKHRRKYDPEWKELIRKRVYSHVVWTDLCRTLNDGTERPTAVITFDELFDFKIRKSIIGRFSEEGDERIPGEVQEARVDIFEYDKRTFTEQDLRVWERKNDYDEDPMAMILFAISRDKKINRELVEHLLMTLRLLGAKISQVDSSLRNMTNLKVLTLTNNLIDEIKGWNLPRGLRSLQLRSNNISSFNELMTRAPKRLMFLGLAQNKLNKDSNFHLLTKASSCLKVLDLGDNDISGLPELLAALESIPTLRALVLEGNPCAVCQGYKDVVLYSLPFLEYLDNVKLKHEDRLQYFSYDDEKISTGALLMYVYRIINLEKPPKEKKAKYMFSFELEVPLLDAGLFLKEEMEAVREELTEKVENLAEENELIINSQDDKKSEKSGKGKKSGSRKSSRTDRLPSVYKFENVYDEELKNPPRVTTFKSKEFEWEKFLTFPEPVLVIPAPREDLKLLRDTFQSVVIVKLVCQKILPAVTPKVKKPKKGEPEPPKPVTPPDTVLAKMVLSKFTCSLENISWCDRAHDFYWAWDEPRDHLAMSCFPGSLALINYMPEKAKAEKPMKDEVPPEPKPEDPIPSPKIFTIQVGFGLQRYPEFVVPVITDPSASTKEKKK